MIAALVRGAVTRADFAIWALGRARIARLGDALLVEVSDDAAAGRVLAHAGLALAPASRTLEPPRGLVAAVALTLDPLPDVTCDAIAVRPVSVAEASRRLRRRRGLLRRPSAADVRRAHAVLHDEERILAWRRVLWVNHRVARRGVRSARRVVFDRDAVANSPERWTYASDDLLTRWIAA